VGKGKKKEGRREEGGKRKEGRKGPTLMLS
jgi:hypothetical protein